MKTAIVVTILTVLVFLVSVPKALSVESSGECICGDQADAQPTPESEESEDASNDNGFQKRGGDHE